MRLKILACEIFFREICHVASRSVNTVDIEFLPKGLHDIPSEEMKAKLQEVIDRSACSDYDYMLLGYALCNNGTIGITAPSIPLVIPRSHDCIGVFMGGCGRYVEYFNNNPGVYFHTTGWLERSENKGELKQQSVQHKMGMDKSYEELVELYGEDNAAYLYETLCETAKNYSKFAFIEMGIEPDKRFEEMSRALASERGWAHEIIKGDMSLLQRFVDGEWNEKDFLIINPGSEIVSTYDSDIFRVGNTK